VGNGTGREATRQQAESAAETLAVRTWPGRGRVHRTLNAPLYLSSVWEAEDRSQLAGLFAKAPDRGFDTRLGHPTIRLAEERMAALEGADDALLFSSGMGAISCCIDSEGTTGCGWEARMSRRPDTLDSFASSREPLGSTGGRHRLATARSLVPGYGREK
jgi:cystathionine beta-lyase/cystathionine gamma-synthase